jgi:hypothetical protein
VRIKDGVATFHYWQNHPHCQGEYLLATLTNDNVLTFEFDFNEYERPWDFMTVQNRLSLLSNIPISSNKTHHRSKESFIRLWTGVWKHYTKEDGTSSYRREPRYSWTDKVDLPYSKGMQLQLDHNGNVTELLKAEPDRKRQVRQDAQQQAKADTAVLRKLVIAMSRMGAFNEQMQHKIDQPWHEQGNANLAKVNYKEPTGADAEIVFNNGLNTSFRPNHHKWDEQKKIYVAISHDEQFMQLRARAIENGMKHLRKHIYETTNGYEVVEV